MLKIPCGVIILICTTQNKANIHEIYLKLKNNVIRKIETFIFIVMHHDTFKEMFKCKTIF